MTKKTIEVKETVETGNSPKSFERPSKVRISAEVAKDVVERIKNAVYWTPGLTMAGFIEDALELAIEQLEEMKGKAYDQREKELVGGRPMK